MIKIGDHLVSEELREHKFVCDLNACKGACCVEGDAGAPLAPEELQILEDIYPEVEPYLSEKSKASILEQGVWVQDGPGFYETPLVDGKECSYVIFEDGTSWCGIEKAWKEGKIDFQKPISCHLYPIRITELKSVGMDALNYDRWSICNAACHLGEKLKVPVYKFLKAPLQRKYGEAFYQELCEIMEALDQQDPS